MVGIFSSLIFWWIFYRIQFTLCLMMTMIIIFFAIW